MSILMIPICPECWNSVPPEDIHPDVDVAICRACGVAFEPSSSPLTAALATVDLDALPWNFQIRERNGTIRLDRRHHWWRPIMRLIKWLSGLFLILLATFILCIPFAFAGGAVPDWALGLFISCLISGFLIVAMFVLLLILRVGSHTRLTLRPVDDATCLVTYSGNWLIGGPIPWISMTLRRSTRLDFFLNRKWNGSRTEEAIRVVTDGKIYLFGGESDAMTRQILAAVLHRQIHQLSHAYHERLETTDEQLPEGDPAIQCPTCRQPIPFTELAISKNTAYCPHCYHTWTLEECKRLSEIDRIDLKTPCPRIRVRNTPAGLRIVTGNFWSALICRLLVFPMLCVLIISMLLTHSLAAIVLFPIYTAIAVRTHRYRIDVGLPDKYGTMEITVKTSIFRRKKKMATRHASQISHTMAYAGKQPNLNNLTWAIQLDPAQDKSSEPLFFGEHLSYFQQQYIVALLRRVVRR